METTIHHQLKSLYAEDADQTEVSLGRFRMDAVRGDELVEVQWSSLSAISGKCNQLLRRHRLRVVKPVVMRTRITRVDGFQGRREDLDQAKVRSRRWSPKRGSVLDLFEDLVYFIRVFPHSNLTLDIPLVRIEQFRIPNARRRRRSWHKDYCLVDVRLESIDSTFELREATDLWDLVDSVSNQPPSDREHQDQSSDQFNTADLANRIGCTRHQAQQVAYVMRKTGAVRWEGRDRSGNIYRRAA